MSKYRTLDHLKIGLQSTRRLDGLEDSDDVVRGGTNGMEPFDQFIHIRPFLQLDRLRRRIVYRQFGFCNRLGLTTREWRRLGHDGCGLYVDRQTAVDDGDRREPHVASHHDRAGAFVDDNLRRGTEIYGEVLYPRNEDGDGLRTTVGDIDVDSVAVDRGSDGLTKLVVDHVGNVTCRGKIGIEQQERQGAKAAEVDGRFAFDDTAVRNSSDGWMIDAS